jgi:hypothetical protein
MMIFTAFVNGKNRKNRKCIKNKLFGLDYTFIF